MVAHFHLVMAIAPLFAAFAGLYFWFPKMFGRLMNETLGKIHFWVSFVGVYCVFFPMHVLGIGGQMRRLYDPLNYDSCSRSRSLNVFISVSAFCPRGRPVSFPGEFLRQHLGGQARDGEQSVAGHDARMGNAVPHGPWQLWAGTADGASLGV